MNSVTLADNAYEASVTEDGEVLVEVNLNLISPGDYLLVLQPDHRASKKVEFMLTLGAAGPGGPSGTLPSSYSVDTDFFYVNDAVQRAVVSVFCHSGDFAVGGAWAAGPDRTTRYLGLSIEDCVQDILSDPGSLMSSFICAQGNAYMGPGSRRVQHPLGLCTE